jgi:hypothetical protein
MLALLSLGWPPAVEDGGGEGVGEGFETSRWRNGLWDCETGEWEGSSAAGDGIEETGFGGRGGGALVDGVQVPPMEKPLLPATDGLLRVRLSMVPPDPETTEVGVDDPAVDIGASGGSRRVLRPLATTVTLLSTGPDLLITGSSLTDVLRRGS